MASASLYPPSVDTYAAAFVASDTNNNKNESAFCRVYFSLSKLSTSTSEIRQVHVSVVKQSSGQSVINKTDSLNNLGRFRSTGILMINSEQIYKVPNKDNLYYIEINNSDIKNGWTPGWIYKIQLRLSSAVYEVEEGASPELGQAAWMNENAGNFSEWSTYCTTKAIGVPRIVIPVMKNYDSSVEANSINSEKEYSLSISTLEFVGSYSNSDNSEILYSYNLKLYSNDNLIEESGELYTNQYFNPNQFYYLFKHEFVDGARYELVLSYTTINRYEASLSFKFEINQAILEEIIINPITIDNIDSVDNAEFKENFKAITSKNLENEESRVAIKIHSNKTLPHNGNICLRRADSKDNFTTWTDIKIIPCINTIIDELDVVYDYTIESGVWYKYGVQNIDESGLRGLMVTQKEPIIREFEYAYLLGEGGRQLKLNLSNGMSSYTYNYSESKVDTIGGKYPFITRNGNMKYRTFPISGIISFNMDDQHTFTTDKEMYLYTDVVNHYKDRRKTEHLGMYDYKREFDFREKVLAFLQDGKPKLFKSSTEGNILIRLMSVAEQPNQSLHRMIGTFSSTAHEIGEASMENYLKYGFYEVGERATDFKVYTTKLGQLDIDFKQGDDIIKKIWEKYNHSSQNISGIRQTLIKVHHLSLEFSDPPLKIRNSARDLVAGNNVIYDGKLITVYGGRTRYYYFDEKIEFTKNNSLLVGYATVSTDSEDEEPYDGTVHITVDFLYEISEEPYVEKPVDTRMTSKGIGQLLKHCLPDDNIFNEIYFKFYYEWPLEFRRLGRISWACIEANPGAVFEIVDAVDDINPLSGPNLHEINGTGVLNIEGLGPVNNLRYRGMRNYATGEIEKIPCDALIDYLYYTSEGTYKEVY